MSAAAIIALSTFLKSIVIGLWPEFKKRQRGKEIPMKLKNGVWIPWGPVEKIRYWAGNIGIAYCLLILIAFSIVIWRDITGL